MKAPARMNGIRQSASTFWSERNQRERTMLAVAFVVVIIGLFYVLLIDPALTGRQDLEKKLPALRQQAAEVQSMAKEATALAGKTAATPAPPVTRESLEASLTRKGIKPQNVSVTGELIKVQLSGVSFAGTVNWLDEMQRTARLSVVDAVVDAQAQPDTVNATFTLRRSGPAQGS